MVRWLKLWNLKRKMRRALKRTVFHPPYDPDPAWRAEQQRRLANCAAKAREMGQTVVIMDEFAKVNDNAWKNYNVQGE